MIRIKNTKFSTEINNLILQKKCEYIKQNTNVDLCLHICACHEYDIDVDMNDSDDDSDDYDDDYDINNNDSDNDSDDDSDDDIDDDIDDENKIIIECLQNCDKIKKLRLYFVMCEFTTLPCLPVITIPKNVKKLEIYYRTYTGGINGNFPFKIWTTFNNSLETLEIHEHFSTYINNIHVKEIFDILPLSLKTISFVDCRFTEKEKNNLKNAFNDTLPYGCTINFV